MNSGSGKMEATPHTTNDSLAWFRERFKDRLISRKCDIEWAVHSPDLNPPYFYLWGSRRWRHTCIHRAKLSMTRTHSSGISMIFAVIAAFSSPIVWRLFSYTLSHRLQFKSTKFEEIWWTYVGLINIFRGSVFLGHPVHVQTRQIKNTLC
jgi:hypothetical protein